MSDTKSANGLKAYEPFVKAFEALCNEFPNMGISLHIGSVQPTDEGAVSIHSFVHNITHAQAYGVAKDAARRQREQETMSEIDELLTMLGIDPSKMNDESAGEAKH